MIFFEYVQDYLLKVKNYTKGDLRDLSRCPHTSVSLSSHPRPSNQFLCFKCIFPVLPLQTGR